MKLPACECGINLTDFSLNTDGRIWYSYEAEKVTEQLPLLAYVEVDRLAGDNFYSGDVKCDISLVDNAHSLPGGYSDITLRGAKTNDVKWRSRQSGVDKQNCVVSVRKLNAVLGFVPEKNATVILLPEEEWHAFVSIIFIGLGIVYLLGDLEILDNGNTVKDLNNAPNGANWQKLFLLDGPLTALATCASIVFYEVDSYAEEWIIGQQAVLLAGVVANFMLLLACLYLDALREMPLRLLRMLVDVPIFLAILVPVMHASGNLLELGCIIANIMTTYVSQRHWRGLQQTAVAYGALHQAVVLLNVFVVSPAILLTIVHGDVGPTELRVLIAVTITIGALATAVDARK